MGFLLLNALYKAAVKKLRDPQSICLTIGLRATRVPSARSATWLIHHHAALAYRCLHRAPTLAMSVLFNFQC